VSKIEIATGVCACTPKSFCENSKKLKMLKAQSSKLTECFLTENANIVRD